MQRLLRVPGRNALSYIAGIWQGRGMSAPFPSFTTAAEAAVLRRKFTGFFVFLNPVKFVMFRC